MVAEVEPPLAVYELSWRWHPSSAASWAAPTRRIVVLRLALALVAASAALAPALRAARIDRVGP